MLKRFFAPYEEYALRTSLPLTELRPALAQTCPKLFTPKFFVQRLRGLFSGGGEPELSISRRDPIALYPATGTRNFLHGKIELLPLAEDEKGTKLKVTIRPSDRRWFVIAFPLFAAVLSVCGAIYVSAWLLLVFPATALFMWLLLLVCREFAKSETSALRAAFENKLRAVEAERVSFDYTRGTSFQPYYRPEPPPRR